MSAITPVSSDHYRYEYSHAPERKPRPPWIVRAVLNDGHSGSILNCPHPACVQIRQPEPA